MTDPRGVRAIAPFFIVRELSRAVRFYERLGFEVGFSAPAEDPFFAIVGREGAQLLLKCVAEDVSPTPNHRSHEWAPWDAYVSVSDPDALATEFADRRIAFRVALGDREDGLRGFEVADPDGYVLFFGRPQLV